MAFWVLGSSQATSESKACSVVMTESSGLPQHQVFFFCCVPPPNCWSWLRGVHSAYFCMFSHVAAWLFPCGLEPVQVSSDDSDGSCSDTEEAGPVGGRICVYLLIFMDVLPDSLPVKKKKKKHKTWNLRFQHMFYKFCPSRSREITGRISFADMRQKAHDLHIGWGLLSASWCV